MDIVRQAGEHLPLDHLADHWNAIAMVSCGAAEWFVADDRRVILVAEEVAYLANKPAVEGCYGLEAAAELADVLWKVPVNAHWVRTLGLQDGLAVV